MIKNKEIAAIELTEKNIDDWSVIEEIERQGKFRVGPLVFHAEDGTTSTEILVGPSGNVEPKDAAEYREYVNISFEPASALDNYLYWPVQYWQGIINDVELTELGHAEEYFDFAEYRELSRFKFVEV